MSADLIKTPFGFESTAAEVIAGVDLSGKRAIVTGASSGIGVETARALAGAGAAVTLAVRNTEAGEQVAAEIGEGTGNGAVTVGALDLGDLSSVGAFVAAWTGPLDILVNNAGVMAIQELTMSTSGHEMQFATNHLGHFALAIGLHDSLAAAGSARIVSVSSGGHLRSPVVFDDIDYAFRDYDPFGAYGQSKTANVLFAVEASRRWAPDGIVANALMPGGIATPLQRHLPAHYAAQALDAFRASGKDFKRSSRALRHRCCLPLRRCWTVSAVGTSRTATRPSGSTGVASPARAVSHLMRSTRPTPNGCGNFR